MPTGLADRKMLLVKNIRCLSTKSSFLQLYNECSVIKNSKNNLWTFNALIQSNYYNNLLCLHPLCVLRRENSIRDCFSNFSIIFIKDLKN